MKKIDIKQFAYSVLLTLGVITGANAQNVTEKQVLVGGTDFDPIESAKGKVYVGTEEIKMTGVIGGELRLYGTQPSKADDLGYDYSKQTSNFGETIASHFHDGEFMAITGNPIQLDSLHYIDDKENDWGVVWSRFNGTASKTILNYRVDGLKPNSSVRVIIKYRSVIDPDAEGYDKLKCSQNGSQLTNIRVAENPDQYNLTAGQDATQIGHGEAGIYDNSKVMGSQISAGKADTDGSFFLNANMNSKYMEKNCSSLQITSIEVYGTIDPHIYSEEGETVCAGEIAHIKAKNVFKDAQYQWYEGEKAIAGATSPNYSFETSSAEKTYNLQLKVTYDGMEFTSDKLTINAEKCCEIINGEGISAASRKIVFKEDFGEFDLSDATGMTYKVWDYSDIANPVQITKKTKTPFRYELDYNPLGCTFQGKEPLLDGEYTVAGVLTGYNGPYKGMEGAKLEWAGDLHGVKLASGMHYDHSGKPEGCCLIINCKDQTGGQNIYEREITNLCQDKNIFFECYISIFTSSAAGAYTPVDVTVRLTEIGNTTNVVENRATQTIPKDGGTGDWVKISGSILLEKGSAVKLEVVNNVNTDQNGNDLVIDDITLLTCAAPSLQAHFDDNDRTTENVTCDGNDINIVAKPTELLTNYFGSNISYLYQWTLTPDNKKSWMRIDEPTDELKMEVSADMFEGLQSGDKIYFRAIAGSDYTLSNITDEYFNPNDPCAAYSVSEPIVCKIECHECTGPDAEFRKPTTEFCEGEGEGLVDMKLTDGKVSDYTIHWWKGADSLATPLADDLSAKFFESLKATEGGIFSYQLVDKQTGCKGEVHNFEVIVNPIPKKPSDENILYELTREREILTTDKFNQTIDSTLRLLWYTNVDEPSSKGMKSVEVYLNNSNEETSFIYYIAYQSKEGCFSERAKVDVTVSPITSVESIFADENEIVNVYTISGALIKANVKRSDALNGLANGTYVIGNQKVIVK